MYCKNCGSILPSNANFCHVCGAKVEIDDIFDAPKDELKEAEKTLNEEFKSPFEDAPKKEEPTFKETPKNDIFYGYQMSDEEQKELQKRVAAKKAFIPGLIGTIGTTVLAGDAGLTYLLNIWIYNSGYESGVFSSTDYFSNVYNLLTSVGVSLVLATILGSVLGAVGLSASLKVKSKKGMVMGSIALGLAVFALVFAILAFIYRFIVGGKL